MKSALKPNKKWILAAIVLLLGLVVLKIALLLTAKPKVTTDYVAQYNKLTLPANYDPNDNAAEDYQKAYDAFVEMPGHLRGSWREWPNYFNDADRNTFEQWLASNQQALEYFKTASHKPYYWLERHEPEGMANLVISELNPLDCLVEAAGWEAKLYASQGKLSQAFEYIIDCYRSGRHKCRTPSLLIEQLVGLTLIEKTLTDAVSIIDRTEIEPENLKRFQDALQEEFKRGTYVIDFEAEKLIQYDILQRYFAYNKNGTGRLDWNTVKGTRSECGILYECELFLRCLFGPTSNEMVKRINKKYASFEPLKTETPWQLHVRDPGYFKRVYSNSEYCDGSIVDTFSGPDPVFHRHHQTNARKEALLTILAVHRFRADNGALPGSLDELVSDGYLQHVPLDPYSDGPLIYRPIEDDFILYSVGGDFTDDGGTIKEVDISQSWMGFKGAVKSQSSDIVYWPVKRPDKNSG